MVDYGLDGFSPSVMDSRFCCNWYSIIAPDCLVALEDAISGGSLGLSLDFR